MKAFVPGKLSIFIMILAFPGVEDLSSRAFASAPLEWVRPAGNDIWTSGGQEQIAWTGGDPSAVVDIYLDHLDGSSLQRTVVAQQISNSGVLDWHIPDCLRIQPYRLYIEQESGSITGEYSQTFNIQPPARILAHVTPIPISGACASGRPQSCSEAVMQAGLSTSSGPFQFVYLMASFRDNQLCWDLAGLQCGIDYGSGVAAGQNDGHQIDVFSWTLCGDVQFSSAEWPQPGSGNIVTWDPANNCQTWDHTGGLVVAGYFYVAAYSPDKFQITPHPAAGAAKLAACHRAEMLVPVSNLGYVMFSDHSAVRGCNPCLTNCTQTGSEQPIPSLATTWSGIKALSAH